MRIQSLQMIKDSEALRLTAYLPTPNDRWTIGWGHTKNVTEGMVITEAQAEAFLREDVSWVEVAINTSVKVGLNQNQFDALGSFVFNLGETNFASSTLLRKLNAGDYEGAAHELPRWNKQKGVVLRGLVRRRAEEMELFLSPEVEVVISTKSITPDAVSPLKLLSQSRELLGGSGAVVTAVGGGIGMLVPSAQAILSAGLVIALLGFGAYIIYNRLQARKRGER